MEAIFICVGFLIHNIFFTDYDEENYELNELKEEAIERGFAEYNSQTDEWQWKDKQ